MKKVLYLKKIYELVGVLIIFSAQAGEHPVEISKLFQDHVSKQKQETQGGEKRRQEQEVAAERKKIEDQKTSQIITPLSQPVDTTMGNHGPFSSQTASGKTEYGDTLALPLDTSKHIPMDEQAKIDQAAQGAFNQNSLPVNSFNNGSAEITDRLQFAQEHFPIVLKLLSEISGVSEYSGNALKKALVAGQMLNEVQGQLDQAVATPMKNDLKKIADQLTAVVKNAVNNQFIECTSAILGAYGDYESTKDLSNSPLSADFIAKVKSLLPQSNLDLDSFFNDVNNFLSLTNPTLQQRQDFLKGVTAKLTDCVQQEDSLKDAMTRSILNPQLVDQSLQTFQKAVNDLVQKMARGQTQVDQQAAEAQVVLKSALKPNGGGPIDQRVKFAPEVTDSQGGIRPLRDGAQAKPTGKQKKKSFTVTTDSASISDLLDYSIDGFSDVVEQAKKYQMLSPEDQVKVGDSAIAVLKDILATQTEVRQTKQALLQKEPLTDQDNDFIKRLDVKASDLNNDRKALEGFVNDVQTKRAEGKIKSYTDQMVQLNTAPSFSDEDVIKLRQLARDLSKVQKNTPGSISYNALFDQALQISQFDKKFQASEGDFQKLSELMTQPDSGGIRKKYFSKALEYELQKIEVQNKIIADKKQLFDTGKMSAEEYRKFLLDNQNLATAQEALQEFNDALKQVFSTATQTPEMQTFIKEPLNYIQRQYDAVVQLLDADNKKLFSFAEFGDRVSKLTDYSEKLQKISKDILTLLTNKPLAFEKSSDGKTLSADEVKLLLLDELGSVVSEFPDIQAAMKDKPATALLSLPREDLLRLQERRKVILEQQMNGNPAIAHEWNQVRDFSLVLETPETFALFEQKLAGQSLEVDTIHGTALRDKIISLYTEVRTELEAVDKLKVDLSSAQEIQKRLQGSPSDVSLKNQKAEILNRMQKRLAERYSDLEDIIAKIRIQKPLTSNDMDVIRDCVDTASLEKQLYETLDPEHENKTLSDLLSKVFSNHNDGLMLVLDSEWLLNKSQIQAAFIQDVQTRASAFTIPKSEVARWQKVQKGMIIVPEANFDTELATISKQSQTVKDLLVDITRALDALKKNSQDKTTTALIKNLQDSQARLNQTSAALDLYKTFLRTNKVTKIKQLFDTGNMTAEAYRDFLNDNKDVPAGKAALQEFTITLKNAFSSATQTPEMKKFVNNPLNYLNRRFNDLTVLFDKENSSEIKTANKLKDIEKNYEKVKALSDVVTAVATSSGPLAFEKDATGKPVSLDDIKLLMVSELGSVVSQIPAIQAQLKNKPVTALLSLPREDLFILQQAKEKELKEKNIGNPELQQVRDFGHVLKTPELFALFSRKIAGNPLVIDESKAMDLLKKINEKDEDMHTFINNFNNENFEEDKQ